MGLSESSSVRSLRTVVIGGGTGLSALLRGLKGLQPRLDITAIVTTFDDGGSSGILRREFKYPGLGDLRQCIAALTPPDGDTNAADELLNFRFPKQSALAGHTVGNILLAALLAREGDIATAVEQISRLMRIQGRVLPVSLEAGHLCAELSDGQIIYSESAIDLRESADPSISRVFLRYPVEANPAAIEAVLNADAIVLGPGDLFTSVLPNILPVGMKEVISESDAKLIFVCNLTTKHGETDGFTASDFVSTVNKFLSLQGCGGTNSRCIDTVIVNECDDSAAAAITSNDYSELPVEVDEIDLRRRTDQVVYKPLLGSVAPARHDSEALSNTIVEIMQSA